MSAYYNENDPYAAQWLRNLIAAGHIAPGEVDERSITEVQPSELREFTQCHFFAGISGWSYALRLAGWSDERPVWTGSCPCQPLSGAGQRKGHADERHLWPAFHRLIAERGPPVVFGEQVASKDGREWFAGVRTDLEALGYACGGADLCAASVGAPHIRQRLYWVADSKCTQPRCSTSRLGNANLIGTQRARREECQSDATSEAGRVGEPSLARLEVGGSDGRIQPETLRTFPWETTLGASYIDCADGKTRRIEPSIQPLAHGVSGRVGRLCAYGNAIIPQVAAEFIKAVARAKGESP